MAEENDQTDRIAEVAAGPASASGDQGSITQQSIPDLIEADKYMAAKRASARGGLGGIRFVKIIPPGNG